MSAEITTITPGDLRGFRWSRGGVTSGRLIEAWRQSHYAAQAAAEVGKGWATPREDDSHSALTWSGDTLCGVKPARAGKPVVGALWMTTLTVGLQKESTRKASLDLSGKTLEEATEWIRAAATNALGALRQEPVPAPDLPDHPLGAGAAFDASDRDALRSLASLYGASNTLCANLTAAAGVTETPQCWPHHFDLATLIVVARDSPGAMTKTIGVGVTPPDTVEPSGYLYVSGWSRDGVSDPSAELTIGRWKGSMAVAPLSALDDHDAAQNEDSIAAFVATSFNALLEAHGNG